MKRMGLVLIVVMLSALVGWGEQLKPGEQARASVASHRSQAQYNEGHHKGGRRHHKHHRKHQGA
jgi:hypothetical protein